MEKSPFRSDAYFPEWKPTLIPYNLAAVFIVSTSRDRSFEIRLTINIAVLFSRLWILNMGTVRSVWLMFKTGF